MSGKFIQISIREPARNAAATLVPVCSAAPVRDFTKAEALPQCSYHESGGAQCERESKHDGGHAMPDAVFNYLQLRWGHQGPRCRTRRGPAEYIYEYGPM